MSRKLVSLRSQSFRNQGGRCCYCGVPMWLRSPQELLQIGSVPPAALQEGGVPARWIETPEVQRLVEPLKCTAEHLLAQCEGGTDTPANVAAACLHCNRTRHQIKPPPTPDRYRDCVRRCMERGGWHPRWVHDWALARW